MAEATLKRIAEGVRRFVLETDNPFVAPSAPATFLLEDRSALAAAFLAKNYTGVVGSDVRKPIGTVTSIDHHSLVTAYLVKLRGTCRHGQDLRKPLATVTAGGNHLAAVYAFLIKYYGPSVGQNLEKPIHTITTKHRFGLVLTKVQGQSFVLADIGLRMLQPRELFRAQGFPENYIIDRGPDGRRLSKADQVRLCGNSVPPQVVEALVRANMAAAERRAAA